MATFAAIVFWTCQAFLLIMMVRVILDAVQLLARDWRPEGGFLIVANIVYKLTDPPIRFVGRWVKPLRMGSVALDLAFLVVFMAVIAIQFIARLFM